MMAAPAPVRLLRSPPFPGVDAQTASIDLGAGDWRRVDPARVRSAAAAMADASVGGAFWRRPQAGRERLIVAGRDAPWPTGDLGDAVVIAKGPHTGDAPSRGALLVDPDDVDPWSLVGTAAVTMAPPDSEIALLAWAAGKPVVGPDGRPAEDGEQRLARALFGRRYRDPFTGTEIEVEAAIALLAGWRSLIDANRDLACATGMAFWKRREVARLLWDGRPDKLPFLGAEPALALAGDRGGAVAAWPARVPAGFAQHAADRGRPVRWVEDGFLRSAGLGSDLLPPLSLIVDDLWPYFDPGRPSRLETILQHTDFAAPLLARAAALRATIVERRIGKYHVGGSQREAPDLPAGVRIVLVVGQVEDDLSVSLGGGGMTNLALIERVRAAEPDAFILYRPHPDVAAGHRRGAIPEALALGIVDRVAEGGSLDALLARADVLHTLTSLTGFEALMRGVPVVVHGSPFYAGWGLTDDRGPALPRRTRRLSLDQLVAGALILYPRYLDPRHGLPCSPETFIGGLEGVGVHAGWLVRLRRWQGWLRRLFG